MNDKKTEILERIIKSKASDFRVPLRELRKVRYVLAFADRENQRRYTEFEVTKTKLDDAIAWMHNLLRDTDDWNAFEKFTAVDIGNLAWLENWMNEAEHDFADEALQNYKRFVIQLNKRLK